jgi:hypothetical protein
VSALSRANDTIAFANILLLRMRVPTAGTHSDGDMSAHGMWTVATGQGRSGPGREGRGGARQRHLAPAFLSARAR